MAPSNDVVSRDGLTVVHEPETALVDIVVLHGFNSSIRQAFTHENGRNWVLDMEYWGELGAKARIMTFQYNANAFRDVIVARIEDHAVKMLEDLYYARRSCKTRPLVFIAHSMGGLVTKRALVEAKLKDDRFGEILRATSSILFLATPHLGARKTSILGIAQRLTSWSKLRSSSHVALSQDLSTFSEVIDQINRAFRPVHIDIIDFYELEETRLPHGSELIVEPASAIMSHPRERHIASAATHRDICRFDDPNNSRFLALWRQIELCVEKTIPEPPMSAQAPVSLLNDLDASMKREEPFCHSEAEPWNSNSRPTRSFGTSISTLEGRSTGFDPKSNTWNGQNYVSRAPEPALLRDNFKVQSPVHKGRGQPKQTSILARLEGWKTYRQREDRLRCHPGTCEWIFGNRIFQRWCQPSNLDAESSILFVVGPSGCGKSVMAHHLGGTLSKTLNTGILPFNWDEAGYRTDNTIVLQFFCRASQFWSSGISSESVTAYEGKHGSPPIVEAFLYQLLESHGHLQGLAELDMTQDRRELDSAEVKRMFRRFVTDIATGHVILMIDGIDECEEDFNKDLLEYLHEIYISCQPIHPIPIWACQHLTIHAQLDNIRQDIVKYTRHEMQSISQSRNFGDNLTSFATRLLEDYSGASFLWASLILREIRELPVISENTLESTITAFPTRLDQYYARVLAKVDSASKQAVSQESNPGLILLVVLFARWDLSIWELVELIAISGGCVTHDDLLKCANRDPSSFISRWLGSLVVIESERVFIAHHSLRSFLDDIWPTPFTLAGSEVSLASHSNAAHAVMAELCLRYLLLEDFNRLPKVWYHDIQDLDRRFPFLAYASYNVVQHLKGAGEHLTQLKPLLLEFLDTEKRNFEVWERSCHTRGRNPIRSSTVSPFGFLCKPGLDAVYAHFLGVSGTKATVPGVLSPSYWNNLRYAFWPLHSRQRVVSASCEPSPRELDLNGLDCRGLAPVHHAARHEHDNVLADLSARGACLTTTDYWSATALHHAAYSNSTHCIYFLLESGLDIEAQNCYGLTPLALATSNGSVEAMNLLLRHGAAIDPCTDGDDCPLFIATKGGSESIALSLLDWKPSLRKKTKKLSTIVHRTAARDLNKLLEVLLSLDPELPLDERNVFGYRPLQLAAINGSTSVMSTLIGRGVAIETNTDVESFDARTMSDTEYPTTPLVLSVIHDQTSSALELIRQGASIDHVKCSSVSLLHRAVRSGSLTLCKALEAAGSDVNHRNRNMNTPLWIAVVNQHVDIVCWLLSLRVKTNTVHRNGRTPLMHAASSGQVGVVSVLIEHAADINAVDNNRTSALHLAVSGQHIEVVQKLLLHGANLDIRTNQGEETALSIAVLKGNKDIVNYFYREGASLTGRTSFGETPLMIACRRGHLTLFSHLLKSVSLDNETELYHQAVESGDLSVLDRIYELNGSTDIDISDKFGLTPFLRACLRGSGIHVLAWFMEKQIDIHRLTKNGSTALHLATYSESLAQVKYLINQRIQVSTRSHRDHSALEVASYMGNAKIMAELIQHTTDLDHPNNFTGATPLHLSIVKGSLECVDLLVASGAHLESQDWAQMTPLLFAISKSARCITACLMRSNASVQARTAIGLSAFELTMLTYHNFRPKRSQVESKRIAQKALLAQVEQALIPIGEIFRRTVSLASHLAQLEDYALASEVLLGQSDIPDGIPDKNIDALTLLRHWAVCDVCYESIQGERFICIVCHDIVLCSKCHARWDAQTARAIECDVTHKYLRVPGSDVDSRMKRMEPELYHEKFKSKLESIKAKYQDMVFTEEEDKEGEDDRSRSSVVDVALFVLRASGVQLYLDPRMHLRGTYGMPFCLSKSMWHSKQEEERYGEWIQQRRRVLEDDSDYDDEDDDDDSDLEEVDFDNDLD